MEIPDNQTFEIILVCPGHEDWYARREKKSILAGEVDRDLKLNFQTTLKPTELHTMWRNTKLFVIRPKSTWQAQIEASHEPHSYVQSL